MLMRPAAAAMPVYTLLIAAPASAQDPLVGPDCETLTA